ncbi:mechanosensitive ion channel domain-containing protein [Methylobrevis albus]|uniref:Mechanosensitive ion channel n=1 Tax=Methylobrevis albus TaxID=2793297 RepID=A0A931MY21_9HYPH|nr:mechanosensitive ion channel domain-containing protein [Methylobrevis albus]MBH0236634.1 mechanosensitive ion channel [Methylobrevis albus]
MLPSASSFLAGLGRVVPAHRLAGALAVLMLLVVPLLAPAAAQTAEVPPAATTTADPLGGREAAAALIEVLGDDRARAALIEELRRLAATPAEPAATTSGTAPAATSTTPSPAPGAPGTETAPATPAAPTAIPPLLESTLAVELGEYTRETAAEIAGIGGRTMRALGNLGRLVDGSLQLDWQRIGAVAQVLASVAAVVVAVFVIGRLGSGALIGMLDRRAARRGIVGRAILAVIAVFADWLPVLLAWTAGNAVAVSLSDTGRMDIAASLFLNTFGLVQLVRLLVRGVLRPKHAALRFLPMASSTAAFWAFHIGLLVSFFGYGVFFLVPVFNYNVAYSVSIGLRVAVVVISLIWAVTLIWRNRVRVRGGLVRAAGRLQGRMIATLLAALSGIWHVLAIGYLVTAFVVWVARPADALEFMMRATLWTLGAIAVGGLVSRLLTRGIANGVPVPLELRTALPLFEKRLNLFVPTFLQIVRLIVALCVMAVVLQAWSLVDVAGWLGSESGVTFLQRLISAGIIVLVMIAIWLAAMSWIEYRLNPNGRKVPTPRVRTLLSLFRNAFTILLSVIALMLTLSELGVDIAPLIAGAGVVGLAVGFGSQKLVQDIITGAFIQFENAMNEGDVVEVAGISGVVEHLTIRSVGLRDVNGIYHVVPFSSVDSVSNSTRGFAFHVADISVAYKENIGEVKRAMQIAFDRLMETDHAASILEPLETQGVTMFAESGVTVRARIKTTAGQQWAVGRAYSELLKAVFDENHIEMPFPQRTLWFANPQDGATPDQPGLPPGQRPPAPASERARREAARAQADPEPADRRPPSETLDVPDSDEGPNR